MHFSPLEKLGFGVLIAAWLTWGTNSLGNALLQADVPEKQGYEVAVAAPAAKAEKKEEEPEDALALLASADVARGEKVFKKCGACHNAAAGAGNKVGPNLWDIVGAKKAGVAGYSYSGALSELGGEWTYANLDKFLLSPKAYAPGNKMTFRGVSKATDRAALLVYLRSLSDSPKPLP